MTVLIEKDEKKKSNERTNEWKKSIATPAIKAQTQIQTPVQS